MRKPEKEGEECQKCTQKIREEFVSNLFPKWWLSPACKNPGQPLQEPLPYYRPKKHGWIFFAEILAFPPPESWC